MKKVLNLIALTTLVLIVVACGVTAKQTGSKKSDSSGADQVVAPAIKYALKVRVNNPLFGNIEGIETNKNILYSAGENIVLTANPLSTWKFDKWTGDVDSSNEKQNPLTVTMDKDKNIRARFISINGSKTLCTLEVKVATGQEKMGSVAVGTEDANEFEKDDVAPLSAEANPTYKFVKWEVTEGEVTINYPNNPEYSLTVSDNCVITAIFAEE